ncbi:MAG TPA: hypothetical protein VI685_23050 [Candidatus Angelobacter sp.]
MSRLKVLRDFRRVTFEVNTYVARCSFIRSGGDAAMALFMTLADIRDQIAVQSVGLSLPTYVPEKSESTMEARIA